MRLFAPALLLTALLLPAVASAQGSGELRGTVTDTAGAPVPLADVILEPYGVRARTDSSGSFRFRAVPARTHLLRVRRIGYVPYEDSVAVERTRTVVVSVRLNPRAQVLAQVRVMDQNTCDLTSLEGFECRRAVGVGIYRDAGELYALKARQWADLVDGIESLRRVERIGPLGVDWMPAAMPSRCLRRLFNGQPEMDNRGAPAEMQPDYIWQPTDVVAIEYYDNIRKVPTQYQRFAWPRESREGCALIIYWLRGADSEPPEAWRRNWRSFGRTLASYGMRGMLENNPDPTSFNAVFSREVQWRGILAAVTPDATGRTVRVSLPRISIPTANGSQLALESVEFSCPRTNPDCADFNEGVVGKEILFRTTLVSRGRDSSTVVRVEGTGAQRRLVISAYNGMFLRVIE